MSKLFSVFVTLIATCSPIPCIAAPHFGSSPFSPPDETDTTFVVDQGTGLDTGCTFRSEGPLVFQIKIGRYVGDINADGTLKDPDTLIANGVVSNTATLRMPAYDVDFSASMSPPYYPERDRVLFNGTDVDFLNGLDSTWVQNSLNIPISLLKFPARAPLGSTPTPAINTITINIDTANTAELWCTAIDWAELSFKAISPLVLIHGNNSNGGFFDRQGFTQVLANKHIPYDNSINLLTRSVVANGASLDTLIPVIVKSFGVDSIHFVVHSKGGLDSREYLAQFQSKHDKDYKVLSYTSLSTPHNGSVLADLLVDRETAATIADEIKFSGFPNFTEKVLKAVAIDDGTRNLTTTFTAGFNATNIPRLPSKLVVHTVAADADVNGNQEIDRDPDEYAELRAESTALRDLENEFMGETKSRIAVDVPYQILRGTASITLTFEDKETLFGKKKVIATLKSNPNRNGLGNDVLVTTLSGRGDGTISGKTTKQQVFDGAQGRNHSSVANAGVASTVLPWIIDVDKTIGDLK